MKINLHSHTNCSDGMLSPTQLAEKYKDNCVDIVALTDHDTVDGVEKFIDCFKNSRVKALTGVEFSIDFSAQLEFIPAEHHFHLLAYDFDLGMMQKEMEKYAAKKNYVGENLVRDLSNEGFSIKISDFDGYIDRIDIANWLVKNKYAKNINDAFIHIIYKYQKTKTFRYSDKEIISIIHSCGGKAFWAHPYDILGNNMKVRITYETVALITEYLANCQIDGIEANYQPFSHEQCSHLRMLADKYKLLMSYGTDFHARNPNEKLYMEIEAVPEWIS